MNTRRKILILGAASVTIPLLLSSCATKDQSEDHNFLQTISTLLKDLFPKSIEPILVSDIVNYIERSLDSKFADRDDKLLLQRSAIWLDESSIDSFNTPYHQLNNRQREAIIEKILSTNWGDSFVWTLTSYYFEALLSDPIYRSNINKAGWIWLDHTPGEPRPKKALF